MFRKLLPTHKLQAGDILDERIRLESISTAIGSLGVMTIACVMYLIFPRDLSNIQYLDLWLYIQLPTGSAWLIFIYFHQQRGTSLTRTLWPYLSTLICSYYGLVWGVGWVYFTSDANLEHIKASVVFTITLGGVFTGGVLATLFHLPSLLSFTLCSLLPPLLSSFIHTDIFHTWFGLSLCIYMIACMAFALNLHNFLLTTLEQREEKKQLAQRIEKNSKDKTRLLVSISHDLRQPLQALRFNQYTLQQLLQHTTAVQPSLEHLEKSLDTLQGILDSLLDATRFSDGTQIVQRQCFPLESVFQRIYQDCEPSATEAGLQLRYVSTSVYVDSDPALLESILRNLVKNAIRHMGATGKILFGVKRQGKQLRIEVRDNGIGIPLQEQEAIFLEYYQLHNPERNRNHGLGLGLALIKGWTHALGHELSLWSQEGKGCVFKLIVPLALPPIFDVSQAATPVPITPLSKKILVIDDDEQILASLKALLLLWDYEAITVLEANPEKILADHPDIYFIISDYQLSAKQTGLEVIQQLRQFSQREIPALLLTGNITPALREQFQQLDIPVSYKPINPIEIQNLIMATH